MKAMKRRLLSLLLAMAMVCTLVPTALASVPENLGARVSVNPNTAQLENGEATFNPSVSLTGTASNDYTITGWNWTASGGQVTNGTTASPSVKYTSASNSYSIGCTVTVTKTADSSTATFAAEAASVSVTAASNPITMDNITGSKDLVFGGTQNSTTLSVTVSGDGANASKVSWSATAGTAAVEVGTASTSNSNKTSSVVVTAKDPGATSANVTITASYQGETISKSCSFTVSKQATTPTITLTPAATSVQMGSTLNLTVAATNAPNGAVVAFDVSNTAGTGTVSGSASPYTFTPSKVGSVTITAKLMSGSATGATLLASDSKTITVNPATVGATLTTNASTISVNGSATLTVKPTGLVAGTDYDYISWVDTQSGDFVRLSSGTSSGTGINANTAYGYAKGSATIYARLMKNGNEVVKTNSVTIEVVNTNPITISTTSGGTSISKYDLAGYGSSVRFYANIANANSNNYSYSWTTTSGGSSVISLDYYYNSFVNIQAVGVGQTTLTVVVTLNNQEVGRASVYITVGQSGLQPYVTVSGDTDYLLSDRDSLNQNSVVSQLESMVNNYSGRRLYSVVFSNVDSTCGNLSATRNGTYYADGVTASTGGRLSDIVFSPRQNGKATFSFNAYYSLNGVVQNNSPLSGVLTIEVKDSVSNGDINYTASIGDDVYFDMGDFEDFYYSKTSRGTLDHVTFTMPSGGYLYSDRNRLSASSATCYVSPRSNENDLGSVYFSPTGTTASRAGTVRVSFTAYGNRSNVAGTVAITYLNGAAKDINYSTVGGSVTLDPQDFIDAYKEVTGKTAPSNLTIQFQEVPSNGTLTYTGGSRDVDLTKSNVRSNKYSTKTTGSYRLNQLTYTGTRGTDTIEYIAYSGSAAQFTGKVVFNGTAAVPTDVVVTYGSTGGQAVMFTQNDFVRANSVMSNAVKVRFVVPTNGTLTMNGSNAAGIDIASSLLGSVSYKPKAGFNGTDRIIFAAYDSRSQLVASGSVNITVVGNTGTSTTTPGGVTDVSQFKDVSSSAWYRNDLATLVSQGIITGKGEGKFDPLGTVTYGEALKMILEACGYTATLGTGSNWAINYKNLAVSNGWISSSIELNAAISRNATAELAARVMGVAPATSGSPFADEANAYAVALYYTNPQIFVGDNTTGKLLFKNGSPLLRQEVCAVICRVRNYHTQHTTNTMPDGI